MGLWMPSNRTDAGKGGGVQHFADAGWCHSRGCFYGSTFVNGTPSGFWRFCALVELNSESLAFGFLQCSLWQNIISEDWKSKWKVGNSMFFFINESILFSFCWSILVHLWNKGTGTCGLIGDLFDLQVRIRDAAARRRFWLPSMKLTHLLLFIFCFKWCWFLFTLYYSDIIRFIVSDKTTIDEI